ncbi:MAG: hypothetical protein KDA85_22450, partial [Planctomycetaceae bacterium]|nr:hypothetical protein [Planctomycetaceae bacterium]
ELYPTIEILDHLHAPAGTENDYPIPVVFTAEDIRDAIAGRLVTKVVYLEQPSLAMNYDPLRREIPQSVDPSQNAVQKADQLGRPMILVRLGGRLPSRYGMPLSFFGSGGAVVSTESMTTPNSSVQHQSTRSGTNLTAGVARTAALPGVR